MGIKEQVLRALSKGRGRAFAAAAAALITASLVLALFGARTGSSEASELTYEQALEARLESILSRIDGAGRVRVMLTCGKETEGSFPSLSAADSGADVRGVIVVAEGASSISVMNALREAAVRALGVPASAVGVFPMD